MSIFLRIRAISPICHGGFGPSVGNAIRIRRESIVTSRGAKSVPCISGNSIRGICRRIVFTNLLEESGLDRGSMPGKQWDMLYAALANGGHLTGKEKTPHPDRIREIREQVPPLSVFGSALYSFLLPGRVRFGFAWPVSMETVASGLVSDTHSDLSSEDCVSETGLARHIERENQDPKLTGVTPMPLMVDSIAAGTEIECRVLFQNATALEQSCVAMAVDQISHLGGKVGAGFGSVLVSHNGDASEYSEWLGSVRGDCMAQRLKLLAEQLCSP